jgi:rhomboid protease GluP
MKRAGTQAFGSPRPVTYFLILLNVVMLVLTLISLAHIDPVELFLAGALKGDALIRGEYWRLVTYAFVHGNFLDFGLNMVCNAAWGGRLEHRLGAANFAGIYLASAAGGGIASLYGHAGPFLTFGASGAISGIIGALLYLTALGKIELSVHFFVVAIGINVLMAAFPTVDWMTHLGGFMAGLATCALLNGLGGMKPKDRDSVIIC